jgi:hypothetical protein
MFCALNGATRKPRRRSKRQIAVAVQLLPAWDDVPTTIMALAFTRFSEPNVDAKERVQARVGAEAQQPTFTFSSKQRPACVRQVSWLSGHRGRPGLPRFPGGRRSERPSPITVAGPRGILTRFPILSAVAEHLMQTAASQPPL